VEAKLGNRSDEAQSEMPALTASSLHCINFFAVNNILPLHRFPNWLDA
jgi:hypothetical protein